MKRIALLGMPNTGKSTFFNRITGARARVGNWPGITVDLMSAKVLLGTNLVELVDLPGIYDLPGFSEDEQVVQHFLEKMPVDLVLVIINTTQIERQLSLVLQLKHLNLPTVILLNMSDEARHYGIRVDATKLSTLLNMPVVLLSAKYGEGYPEAYIAITQQIKQLDAASSAVPLERITLTNQEIIQAETASVLKQAVQTPSQLPLHLTHRIDKLLLHTWLGLPLFFLIMYLLFQTIFWLGKPLQTGVAWVFDTFKTDYLATLVASLPVLVQGLLLNGIYDGVSTVASFVPIIILFFIVMTIVEDSGYLSRAAFLVDALMAKIGLDGRSFVMMLMGFGCNVPALMGTRVMRSRNLRLLSMLVIPFSLCSARLQVFIFFISALFAENTAGLALFSLYVFSFAATFLTALLFKNQFQSNEPFVLEIPPYRFPTLQQVILRSWQEIRHFLTQASKFIILGVVLVWLLTHFPTDVPPASSETWAGMIGLFFAPLFNPIGINQHLIIALIFGFVAKEIVIGALAVIYALEGPALTGAIAQQIDWIQAYSFMVFTLLYTPCLSTIVTIRNESKSVPFTVFSVVWSLCLAWLASFVFYQTARYFFN